MNKTKDGMVSGRRRNERLRNSWIQDVITGMREKVINSMEWIGREEFERENELKLKQIKSVAYSSQGSHNGQLDLCD